jgi:Zn finger protein HypA/HybF involved in hydrogenase expression
MVANYHVAVGDQNSLGQYLVDRTVSADKRPRLRIACIHCGKEYLAADVNFHRCKCPSCQSGADTLLF